MTDDCQLDYLILYRLNCNWSVWPWIHKLKLFSWYKVGRGLYICWSVNNKQLKVENCLLHSLMNCKKQTTPTRGWQVSHQEIVSFWIMSCWFYVVIFKSFIWVNNKYFYIINANYFLPLFSQCLTARRPLLSVLTLLLPGSTDFGCLEMPLCITWPAGPRLKVLCFASCPASGSESRWRIMRYLSLSGRKKEKIELTM